MITNPILPGFNPDPSICRVGADYYIATSTFEWYPGVQIHHSRDLVNWTLVKRPLDRAAQLDMRGAPDSCGVWAPCLSHADGLYWLVYTDVKRYSGIKDTHNYIVTAPAIEGPWSDPVHINSSGFDPSLFHDDDGRKYFMNMYFNQRSEAPGGHAGTPSFLGILLQEWDPVSGRLIGPARNVFRGSYLGLVEGPHIFKRKGWYYMTLAEGGTGYKHAVTMARSRDIWGPYEMHPEVHLLTSKDTPEAILQRAGHGQYVETPEGEVYHTHLCSRPLPGTRLSPLGRETAIQKCVWRADDWLYLEGEKDGSGGGMVPSVQVPAPDPNTPQRPTEASHSVFTCPSLPPDFQWLRTPYPDRLFSLTGQALRLHARESIGSWFEQALVARRQEHFVFRAETSVVFAPQTHQQVAGLTLYYNQFKYHALGVTWHEVLGRCLTVISCEANYPDAKPNYPLPAPIQLPEHGPVGLACRVDHAQLRFSYRTHQDWIDVGPVLDASLISDEAGRGVHGSFTGAFVGMVAFDLSGGALPADFSHFNYEPA
jgi:xylan 1,4-beta-xylosidase